MWSVHNGLSDKQKADMKGIGGFRGYPFWLIAAGWSERKNTGRTPDPIELARRLNSEWVAQLNYLDYIIEEAKPKTDGM